mmetsp:Transcript_41158/g.105217  ORF Transcript_41158/g.105217 Transcript_41158/m.105217 type:complete len:261 (-) Transcript_41158:447-1229(-)
MWWPHASRLPQLDIQDLHDLPADLLLLLVDLLVGEGALVGAVDDAVAVAGLARLWVFKLVNELDLLHQVAGHVARDLAEVILAEFIAYPEANVLVAGWELGVGLELGAQLAWGELLGEALIFGPEQPDVGNVKKHHRQALQAQPKRPGLVLAAASVVQDGLLHHAAAQDLHPLPLEEDLQLKGRIREGKVVIVPAHLHFAKEGDSQPLQHALELPLRQLRLGAARGCRLLSAEQADSLHLVEDRVVRGVDRVTAVHVASD